MGWVLVEENKKEKTAIDVELKAKYPKPCHTHQN